MATRAKKAKETIKEVEVHVGKKQVTEMFSGCSLSFPWFGTMRSVGTANNAAAAASIEAEEHVVHTTVTIIDTRLEEYKNLGRIRTAAQGWYDYNTVPYVVRGQRLFMRDRREAIWEGVKERREVLKEAASKLNNRRDDILAWAQKSLGKAFDANLYPKDFTDKFDMVIREHSIDPPSYLAHTNADEYKRTLELTLRDMGESMKRFEQQCMAQVGQSVQTLASQLNGDSAVRQTTLDGLLRVLNRVGQMKFEGTQMFNAAMSDAKEIIDGVEITDLRRPGGVRADVKDRLQALLARYAELREASTKKALLPE